MDWKKVKIVWILGALTALALIGCDGPAGTQARFGENGPFTIQGPTGTVSYRSTNDYVFRKIADVAKTPQSLRSFLNNTTSVSWDDRHGTQVEYLGANGRTFRWYPGNQAALPGKWQLGPSSYGPAVCFLYGPNTYNPVTGSTGSQWDCSPQGMYIFYKTSVVSGDVFNLSSGKIPFVLPGRAKLSLPLLAARAGLSGTYVNNADWGAILASEQAASAQYSAQSK